MDKLWLRRVFLVAVLMLLPVSLIFLRWSGHLQSEIMVVDGLFLVYQISFTNVVEGYGDNRCFCCIDANLYYSLLVLSVVLAHFEWEIVFVTEVLQVLEDRVSGYVSKNKVNPK